MNFMHPHRGWHLPRARLSGCEAWPSRRKSACRPACRRSAGAPAAGRIADARARHSKGPGRVLMTPVPVGSKARLTNAAHDPKETLTLLLPATGEHLEFASGSVPRNRTQQDLSSPPCLHVQRVRIIQRCYDPLGRKTHRDRGADADLALQIKATSPECRSSHFAQYPISDTQYGRRSCATRSTVPENIYLYPCTCGRHQPTIFPCNSRCAPH